MEQSNLAYSSQKKSDCYCDHDVIAIIQFCYSALWLLSDKCLQHCIIKTKEDIYVKGWFICWFVWQILYAITRLTAYLRGNILAPNHVDAVITFADVHLCTFISISPLKFYAGTKPY